MFRMIYAAGFDNSPLTRKEKKKTQLTLKTETQKDFQCMNLEFKNQFCFIATFKDWRLYIAL